MLQVEQKILNLKTGVGIDFCNKKLENKKFDNDDLGHKTLW